MDRSTLPPPPVLYNSSVVRADIDAERRLRVVDRRDGVTMLLMPPARILAVSRVAAGDRDEVFVHGAFVGYGPDDASAEQRTLGTYPVAEARALHEALGRLLRLPRDAQPVAEHDLATDPARFYDRVIVVEATLHHDAFASTLAGLRVRMPSGAASRPNTGSAPRVRLTGFLNAPPAADPRLSSLPPRAWIDASRVEPIATTIEICMDAIGQVMHVATVTDAITALSALHHVHNHADLVVVARTVQRHILAARPPALDLLGWALYYELHGLHGLGDHAGCYQRYRDDEQAGARRAVMAPVNQAWCASVAGEGAAARGDAPEVVRLMAHCLELRVSLGDAVSARQAARSAVLLLARIGHAAIPGVFVPYLDVPSAGPS